MVGRRLLRWKDGKRAAEASHQVDIDILPAVSDCCLPVQSSDVPDAVGDRPAVKLVRFAPVDSFAQLAIRDQEQANPTNAAPALGKQVGDPEGRTRLLERVAPLAIESMPKEVGQPSEDRVHLASDQAPNVRRMVEVGDQKTERVRVVLGGIASVSIDANTSPWLALIRDPVGRVQLTGLHQVFAELVEEDILHKLPIGIGFGENILEELARELLNCHSGLLKR